MPVLQINSQPLGSSPRSSKPRLWSRLWTQPQLLALWSNLLTNQVWPDRVSYKIWSQRYHRHNFRASYNNVFIRKAWSFVESLKCLQGLSRAQKGQKHATTCPRSNKWLHVSMSLDFSCQGTWHLLGCLEPPSGTDTRHSRHPGTTWRARWWRQQWRHGGACCTGIAWLRDDFYRWSILTC